MLLVLLLFLFSFQDNPTGESAISGTATDSITGAPLSKVQVLAEPADRRSSPSGTVTDERGRFTLVHLPPGEYRLKGVRNGYLATYYGARRAGSEGTILSLDAGAEEKGLQLKLLPFAVIAGTVRDPEGEPLVEARVALIALTYRNGIRQLRGTGDYATTDDLGQYRIPNVRPGHYYVRAAPDRDDGRPPVDRSPKDAPPPQTLVPTFYPVAREPSAARKIDLAAGDRFTGADVTLLRSRLFRVRVKLEGPPGVLSGVSLQPRPELSDGLGPHPPSDCKEGICVFTRVPAGSYSAVGSTSPRSMTIDDMFSNSVQTYATVPVEVADADVDGVVVALSAGAEIAGRIIGDREDLRVRFVDADGADHQARFSSDGSFTARLSPGHYEVQVSAGGDLIPTAIRSEETDVLRDGLTVSAPGKLPLEIVLSHDGAHLDGTAHDPDDHPLAGATVVLIPEPKLRSRHDLYQDTNTDQFGRYHFRSITPGEYKLFVWQDVEEGIWFDPDFLKNAEPQGRAVLIR